MIEGILDYTIRLRLMMDASTDILRQLRSESRSLEINDDITVPWIKGANKEKCIVWDMVLRMRWSGVGRKGTNQIRKNQLFL